MQSFIKHYVIKQNFIPLCMGKQRKQMTSSNFDCGRLKRNCFSKRNVIEWSRRVCAAQKLPIRPSARRQARQPVGPPTPHARMPTCPFTCVLTCPALHARHWCILGAFLNSCGSRKRGLYLVCGHTTPLKLLVIHTNLFLFVKTLTSMSIFYLVQNFWSTYNICSRDF